MYFDTHAHYDSGKFKNDRHEVLSAMPENGVTLIVDPGCDEKSSRMAVRLAEEYAFIYAAVGWQPQDWGSWTDRSIDIVRELAAHPKTVAIGEIGLDYYWDKEHKALQHKMLAAQFELAIELDLPVIMHDREAHADCLEFTERYPDVRGVFHCFSGSAEMAEILVKRGWYLGFDGPITYKNARRNLEALEACPMNRVLIETDSPYLTPEPYRGQRNDSALLPYIVDKIAEVKGLTHEQVADITMENGRTLFRI